MPYIDPAQPYSTRQTSLATSYGFACRCSRCLADEAIQDAIPSAPEDAQAYLDLHPLLVTHIFGSPDFTTLSELPEGCYQSLPTELLLLKNASYLPYLSSRFRDASHDGKHDVARESGIALLAWYLTIYPKGYPVVGS